MRKFFDIRSLPVQMITAFMAVVLLTAATVGLPAIWLLQSQLDHQAWSQVAQGQRAVVSLYAAQIRELENLSILTAQRPTLHDLLNQGDVPKLTEYLYILQSGAGLDLIEVCESGQVVAAAQSYLEACNRNPSTYILFGKVPPGETWMTGRANLEMEYSSEMSVIVGIWLDEGFAAQISEETGLEHILCVDSYPVVASLESGAVPQELCRAKTIDDSTHFTFTLNDTPYYAAYLPLDGERLKAIAALDISAIVTTQRQLVGWMAAAIFGVSAVGSVMGVLFSRRISRPLVRLSEAAGTFSRGDLGLPVAVETQVREVALVARTLEAARSDLLKTLTSLQSERDWSAHLLASIVEGIVILDQEGRITFFSQGAERITGWNREEVMGRPCDEIFLLVDSDKSFSSLVPSAGKRNKVDVLLAGEREASLAVTRAELAPSEAAEAEIALVFRDISEEEAVHRILGHFLANIAHEFRTPLSALAASIELLLDQASDLSQTELQELLISLHLGTLGLQTLVDNLLESASIETGRFRVSPRIADLGNIVAEAAQTMQPLLEKYDQRLVMELPVNIPTVRADPRRIAQVLVNLLGNASKYGPSEAEIELKVTATPLEARVEVADRGPGIPPEARANIFRRFVYPHKDSNTSQAGAGLGLSVVKAIVETHGGRVGVEDRPGSGVVFWFTLPIAQAIDPTQDET
jgi:PAS domain S-box-containing protein